MTYYYSIVQSIKWTYLELFPRVLRLAEVDEWPVAAEVGALEHGEGKDVPAELDVVL